MNTRAEKEQKCAEAYLRPPQVLVHPSSEYGDDTRMFQGIPGIEISSSGRLWAVWYGGGRGEDRYNYVLLATSGDGGHIWSGPILVVDPDRDGPVRAFDPCLWHDPRGRLWLFWAQGYQAHTDRNSGVWSMCTPDSEMENPQWSEPVRHCDGVMLNKPTVLSSGEWLLPVARWHSQGSAGVYRSTDDGRTWELIGQATVPAQEDRSGDEHQIIERRDGTLWMLVRTRYGIGESASTDRGRTWTPVEPSGIRHPAARFFLRTLRSGNVLLVKHGPIDERIDRSHLMAFASEDDGRTWSKGLLLDERPGVSYPDGIQAADKSIFLIYDHGRTDEREILMAKIAEEDVLEGKCVSRVGDLKMLVNKATATG